jgi:hypothetical protein
MWRKLEKGIVPGKTGAAKNKRTIIIYRGVIERRLKIKALNAASEVGLMKIQWSGYGRLEGGCRANK